MTHRAHFSHGRGQQQNPLDEVLRGELPSHLLHPESDHLRSLLEELDDVIFLAIKGDPQSLDLAHRLWPQVVEQVDFDLLDESRAQYLRYANEVIRHFQQQEVQDPVRAFAAIDIIELLTRE